MKHQNNLNNYSHKLDHHVTEITGTGYLALRDIPFLIQKYSNGKTKVLDFGCGAGRSTRFLKNLGLSVDGIDKNSDMVSTAKKIDLYGNYFIINSYYDIAQLKNYDIIFNSFVLFEFCKK